MIHINNKKVLYVLIPLVYLLVIVISATFSYILNASLFKLEYISIKRVLFITVFLVIFFNLMLVKVFEHHRSILIHTIVTFFFLILIANILYAALMVFNTSYTPLYLSTQSWQSANQNDFIELQQVNAFAVLIANAGVFIVNYLATKYLGKFLDKRELNLSKNG